MAAMSCRSSRPGSLNAKPERLPPIDRAARYRRHPCPSLAARLALGRQIRKTCWRIFAGDPSKDRHAPALVDELEQSGVSLAVVRATIESLFGMEGNVPLTAVREANDWLATLSREHPTLTGFAVVDAFAGEEAAREAEWAIVDLGLTGLVIDSSRDGKLIADPSARPTLDVAARHKVPVFVHPVAHPNAEVLNGTGNLGNSLGVV
ncbi:hypothetical protein CN166_00180 [Sinorhizobium medicae]|nr:hypothetical protein CN166_00180 [Sinorhizobium medicae]RVJ77090.1 hypothetical protein CN167_11550 [Sinorhizobium medicae]